MLAEVEDAGGQDGIGTTLRDAFDEMLECADASRGDDRHVDSFRDRRGERQVEAVLGAVAIHRREQDLPGTETHDFLGPYDGIDASAGPASMREDLKARRGVVAAACVDRNDTALCPELPADLRINSGRFTAAVLTDTLSAPAINKRRASSTVRIPPPIVNGMKTCSATARAISTVVSRSPDDAVMSRNTSSSAPCSS